MYGRVGPKLITTTRQSFMGPGLCWETRRFYRNLDNTNSVKLLDNDRLLEIETLPITRVIATRRRCRIHEARQEIPTGSPAQAGQILVEQCRRYLLDCEALMGNTMPEQALGPLAETERPDVETSRQRLSKYFDNSIATSLMDLHWTSPLPRSVLYDILMTDPDAKRHPRAELAQPYARYIADEFDQ
jgi:hypothetical protein